MERGVAGSMVGGYLYEVSQPVGTNGQLSAAAAGAVAAVAGNGGPGGPNGQAIEMQVPGVPGQAGRGAAPGMDPDENFCLRWNEYEKKYAEAFRVLRDNEYFTDVTLATEGHQVKAHRVILSACSTYFDAILKSMNPWQHPVLLLQDVRSVDLTSLMDFIYFGQVQVNQESLNSFLNVAHKLKIKGLCDSMAPVSAPTPQPPPSHQQPHPASQASQPSAPGAPGQQVGVVGGGHRGGKEVVTSAQQQHQASASQPGPQPHPSAGPGGNFENLLPRSPYGIQETAGMVSLPHQAMTTRPSAPPAHQSPKPSRAGSSGSGGVGGASGSGGVGGVGGGGGGTVRQANEPLMFVSPKRQKYAAATAAAMSPQSILRSQLIHKEAQAAAAAAAAAQGGAPGSVVANTASEHVEVKSEPMAILSTQEDVPSSGINVNEYINQGDLTPLPSLGGGQGISPQFMFSPDPNDPNAVAAAAAAAAGQQVTAMVTVDENNRPIRVLEGGMVMTSSGQAQTVVTSMGTVIQSPMQTVHGQAVVASQQQVQQQQQQHILVTHAGGGGGQGAPSTGSATPGVDEQPQDLTPAQEQNNSMQNSGSNTPTMQQQQQSMLTSTPVGTPVGGGARPFPSGSEGTPGGSASSSPSTPTSAAALAAQQQAAAAAQQAAQHKKDRSSRKTCQYCHKDFHEMSLKRHIKDVHFRDQNTYVICPQCCKQYASQNSLYSHLNRVHGVKREMMADYEIKGPDGNPVAGTSGAVNVVTVPVSVAASNGGTPPQHLVTAVRSVAPPPPGVPLGPPQGAPGTPVIKREIVRTTPGVDQMHLQIGNNSNDGTAGSNHSSPNAAAVAAAAAAGHNHTGGPVGQHPGAQQIGPGGAAPPGAHSDNSHDGIMDLAHHSENSN